MSLVIGFLIGSIVTLIICSLEYLHLVKRSSSKAYALGYMKGASIKKEVDALTKKQGGDENLL